MPLPDPHPPAAAEGPAPLAGLTFALAGPGRVGISLAAWARARGARLVRAAGRSEAGLERLRQALPAGAPPLETCPLEELASDDCDLLLVAVADPALDRTAELLARRPQAPVVLHTAGARDASALAALGPGGGSAEVSAEVSATGSAATGSATGTFHPLKAFPGVLLDLREGSGVFYALDGPPEALALGRRLAAAFGGAAAKVSGPDRLLYHLAATLAAGGVTTLVASAAELAQQRALPPEVARGYLHLARGALQAAERSLDEALPAPGAENPPEAAARATAALARAITGPLARGDVATLLEELRALRATGDEAGRLEWVVRLGLETLRLTDRGAAAGPEPPGAVPPAAGSPRASVREELEAWLSGKGPRSEGR